MAVRRTSRPRGPAEATVRAPADGTDGTPPAHAGVLRRRHRADDRTPFKADETPADGPSTSRGQEGPQ
jgi:hypothetical protein